MQNLRPITTMKLFNAEAIAKNASATSVSIDLRSIAADGIFSVHSIMAGSGTLKLEYLLSSTENGTYVEPAGASDIVAAQASGTTGFYDFDPELAPFLKIKATENNVNPITSLDLWINIQ